MRHKNTKIEVGQKLKQARISCGFTQEDVCEKIGCATRYIGQLETNQTQSSISLILKLCSLYNITLNDLYSDYLNTNQPKEDLSQIAGYFSLNDEYRSIIQNSITFLNKLQNNKM